MEEFVKFCKTYGFIFNGSDIYGGLANTWDYGPLGSRVKNNLKEAWRKRFIQMRKNAYEVDADILMHPKVWEASGHVGGFSDPLIDCKECKNRSRADNLIEDFGSSKHPDLMSEAEMMKFIRDNNIKCPFCGKSNWTDIREFNLMFETSRGVIKGEKSVIYLRPENAQGEYVNFLNVQRSMRAKLPFSIGQIGKAFRNEITPGNFIFRTIEFEQMEFQTFCKKGEDDEIYKYFKKYAKDFYLSLGIKEENLRYKDHEKLVFYAKEACDIEYKFPFGWGEINGTHNRTDYDLSKHSEYSGIPQVYLDPETNEKIIPYVIESTCGLDRSLLAVLVDAYTTEGDREVLKIHPFLAPYKIAILPLIKKVHSNKANEIYDYLSNYFMCTYDESGSIGKRYRRQDIYGTPYCITIDNETLENNTVTIRNRDNMEQITLKLDEVKEFIEEKVKY